MASAKQAELFKILVFCQLVFDGGRGDVFALVGLKDVFYPTGNPQVTVGVELAPVSRVQPAIVSERLFSFGVSFEVASESGGVAGQNFTAVIDFYFASRVGLADRADTVVLGGVSAAVRRIFRHAIALHYVDA